MSPVSSGRKNLLSSVAVFLVSAAVIGLELALMRCLSVTTWHHFAYLVISTALLGFGASGTLLTLVGSILDRRFGLWCTALTLVFALSVPLCIRAAQALPLDPQYVLYSGRQAFVAVVYHLLILVPFLLGAMVIGLSLMHFKGRVHGIYGANLLGSGIGGLLMLLLMFLLSETALLAVVAGLGLIAAVLWAIYLRSRLAHSMAAIKKRAFVWPWLGLAGSAIVVVLLAAVWPIELRIDPYKSLAVVRRYESQSDAEHLITRHGPRGRLDVYASALFHDTLFAGFTAVSAPPSQLRLLVDGNAAGTIFNIENAEGAEILDHTPMSVPYRLIERPKVLLLGEIGGTNVWLARRFNAAGITVVQGNPQIVELITGPLAAASGHVFSLPGVEAVAADPRLFLESRKDRYDIVQLVRAEGMAVGVSSLLSVHEDFLLTREGLALCLQRLEPGGFLAVTRQQQDPPRDNVKLLVTLAEALESLGVQEPGQHIVQIRNYLAVTSLASFTPLAAETCKHLLSVAKELQLDIEWAPGPGFDPTDQLAKASGPPGANYSYYHYAAREIFSPRREVFLRKWAYDVRSASDDRPYFYNFFRFSSLPLFRQVYGPTWYRKLELGYVVVVGVLVEVVVVGSVLILLPLFWLKRSSGQHGGRLLTAIYFLLLGLSYMLLEIVLISKFTHFLGDPILSAGGIVSAFLVASGLGSLASRRIFRQPRNAITVAILGIVILTILYPFILDRLFPLVAAWAIAARFALALLLAAPLAFLMGFPFPNGLSAVQRARPALVPWTWGVNGFASVAGPPLGILLAASGGFRWVFVLAAVLYCVAGLVVWSLPDVRAR